MKYVYSSYKTKVIQANTIKHKKFKKKTIQVTVLRKIMKEKILSKSQQYFIYSWNSFISPKNYEGKRK